MGLIDASTLMRWAVDETIDALELKPEDAAAVRIARVYADQIDAAMAKGDSAEAAKIQAWTVRWITPLLLEALGELGASPAARNRIKKGEPVHTTGKLHALRAAR